MNMNYFDYGQAATAIFVWPYYEPFFMFSL